MCGICGVIRAEGVSPSDVVRMNRRAAHRGPDGEGYWIAKHCDDSGVFVDFESMERQQQGGTLALGHRRLAIVDLTHAGLQPLSSTKGRHWIVFNGEVYNYVELRQELRALGHRFLTRTDTEVILAAFEQWGCQCFERFNGMWALAIVDLDHRRLVLARDRLGIKPLYFSASGEGFAFASEIKQLLSLPWIRAQANMDAVVEYIDTGYESPSDTFFKQVQAFPAGTWGEVSLEHPKSPSVHSYWQPDLRSNEKWDRPSANARLRELFENAVSIRLRSDVPVGVCLSGGLDSSAVFGQVQQLRGGSASETYAFSAAFTERRFSERKYIDTVLARNPAEARFVAPSAQEFLVDLDRFVYLHDEPPGSLSQYAAWSVTRLAHHHKVAVLLNGQGGDELFSGYWPAYYLFLRNQLKVCPWKTTAELVGAMLPGGNPALLTQLVPHWRQYQSRLQRNNREILQPRWQQAGVSTQQNWATKAQNMEPAEYRLHELRRVHLPRLLKWDDRNAMGFGVEARYPFLDYRIVELALSLPPEMNLCRGWNKVMIRESLGHLLPRSIQWRRSKIGFVSPQAEWMRSTLRPVLTNWAQAISERLAEVVSPAAVSQMLGKVLSSKRLHAMDESQILLMRLFFLDRWLSEFQVTN